MTPAYADTPSLATPGVLVADDELLIRNCLEEGLSRHGFVVWTAANGQEALDLFRQRNDSIQIALLDVQMPELDGFQTLRALRAIRPDLPCCFMSGDLGKYTERELLDLGAPLIFQKPFALEEVARLTRHLSERP